MTYNIPDLDIDCSKREEILSNFINIPATKITNVGLIPHGVGVYFCDIPKDLVSGLSTIDYKDAEERLGYVKFDFLHNCELDNYNSRTELINILQLKTNWDLLYDKNIILKLPHINNYYELIIKLPKIDCIEKLAMFISIIRPAKQYCIKIVEENNNWDSIKEIIWKKEDSGYQYKKSHAIAYATLIQLVLNRISIKK